MPKVEKAEKIEKFYFNLSNLIKIIVNFQVHRRCQSKKDFPGKKRLVVDGIFISIYSHIQVDMQIPEFK